MIIPVEIYIRCPDCEICGDEINPGRERYFKSYRVCLRCHGELKGEQVLEKKQPYMTGLKISYLSEEELEKYRQMPKPVKVRGINTLAPQHAKRGSVLATHMNNPYAKQR